MNVNSEGFFFKTKILEIELPIFKIKTVILKIQFITLRNLLPNK